MIAVSLNVGGGVCFIKPAKLCMCTQNTTNTTRTDARRRVCAAMVPYLWATRGTSLRELEHTHTHTHTHTWSDCLLGCFGFNGPLRQSFSLYRVVSRREGERKEMINERKKMSKQHPPAPTESAIGSCPTIIQISRTPQHWKLTQHHRATRPHHSWSELV